MKTSQACIVLVAFCGSALFGAENVTGTTDAGNLLKNASFENGQAETGRPPDDWGFITQSAQPVNGGMTSSAAHTGGYAVYIDKPSDPKDKWQVLAFNAPVKAGSTYEFGAWIKPDPQNPMRGETQGTLAIEWKDADGKELERTISDPWTSKTFAVSGDWTRFKIKGAAPKKAASATFTITYYAGSAKEAGSSFLIDDAEARLVTP